MPSYLVVNVKDKPFGAVLPLEIQNRIMWMSMKMVHQESYQKVMTELKTLPVCQLVDWCSVANPYQPLRFACSGCTECDHRNEEQDPVTCHWCRLYGEDQTSLYQQEVGRKLNQMRDAIGCYEEQKYQQFVRDNRQRYAECIQFSFMRCALPLMCRIHPRDQACHLKIIRQEVTFTEVELSLFVGMTALTTLNGFKKLKNPGSYGEEPYAVIQGINSMTNALRFRAPTLEEVRDGAVDVFMQVYDNVNAFLNENE